ncbi:RNA-binding RNA annealing protein [Friedmanniomyces endolithicus]|nr:RNA-binding RNA annealing protein [Friedmanniomyces endolithicus]KAK0283184.1 RNA-binding RNA annealing protein [Friedmanniomyces endolithicus]KAK0995640.1 RNA-binding RNA annealing protein [Friedmanniomyces endolithicus]
MSGKLDQSLDAIMTDSGAKSGGRGGSRRGPPRRAAVKAKVAPAAPTSGVQKSTRPPRNAPTAPAVVPPGDSKIIVSNLPFDITETQLKDFFTKAVGAVKKVLLSYGPNGRSRGEATVIFNKSTKAIEAQEAFNGVKVDDKAMRVEIVGGSAASVAQAKTLADRMAKPKNAARENTKANVAKTAGPKPAAANGAPAGRREKKKSGRAGKPKAKTADELDAEMADYFGGTAPTAEATNGAAQPAATNGGEVAMQTDGDEVL